MPARTCWGMGDGEFAHSTLQGILAVSVDGAGAWSFEWMCIIIPLNSFLQGFIARQVTVYQAQ